MAEAIRPGRLVAGRSVGQTLPMRPWSPTADPTSGPVRALAAAVIVAVGVLVLAPAAAAHVDGTAAGVGADGATTVVLSFHHGCDGQATTGLAVAVPEGATDVTADDPEGWTSTVTSTEIVWAGGTVPDGEEAEFTFHARLAQPDGATVAVPTVQTCPDGELAWIGPPDAGEDEGADPSPSFVVPAGGGGQAGGEPAGGEPTTTAADADDPTVSTTLPEGQVTASQADDDEGTGPNAGGTAGLVVFLVVVTVILGGATVLYLRHRGTGTPPPA